MRKLSALIGFTALTALSTPSLAASALTVLHSFDLNPNTGDGAYPVAPMLMDEAGNLFTTTTGGGSQQNCPGGCGTVVELQPPGTGQKNWTETLLHMFQGSTADGSLPEAGLVADSTGNLYTTTASGGAAALGTVVELSPPSNGQTSWAETVIYNFQGGTDGANPTASLLADAAGNFYTTTSAGGASGYGTIVMLTPPGNGQTAWTESVLYTFAHPKEGAQPMAALIADAAGNLYTTTSTGGTGKGPCFGDRNNKDGCGTVIELLRPAKPKGKWTEAVLYNFQGGTDGAIPLAGLLADAAGNLYTTTNVGGSDVKCYLKLQGCGTVVELSPPAGGEAPWTDTVLYVSNKTTNLPRSSLLADAAGNLYTTGVESIFKLAPPSGGNTGWTETVLQTFSQKKQSDGYAPAAGLIADSAGTLYTTTAAGGSSGSGTVIALSGSGFVTPSKP